ncbi:methyltransferase domain-containing protein [Pilobolus umbonatus]|nr:methyltransferase domain-containing protein [Pilobolus umbonatus]
MSQLIKQVADERNITSVIDLGSGQGYLSRALAFEHGLEVLAVDMSEIQTKGAVKFDNKALKIQKKSEDGLPNLKHVTERITPENIADVLTRWGSSIDKSWLVTGLHTCGDLSPMIFNLFAECPQVACVVNVGCCYNALTSSGFPMSSYVKKKCMPFGSTARVLSCHSPSRWLDEGEQCITISNNYLFRGLFQEMMVDRGLSDINDPPILGRIKQNKSFPLFVKAALKKMKLPDDTITSEEAEIHYSQCKEKSVDRQFLALWTLRALLSPVIESIILMDRYLYLKSSIQSTHPSDNQGCWMFPLFDQSASPRNVVLIASK